MDRYMAKAGIFSLMGMYMKAATTMGKKKGMVNIHPKLTDMSMKGSIITVRERAGESFLGKTGIFMKAASSRENFTEKDVILLSGRVMYTRGNISKAKDQDLGV